MGSRDQKQTGWIQRKKLQLGFAEMNQSSPQHLRKPSIFAEMKSLILLGSRSTRRKILKSSPQLRSASMKSMTYEVAEMGPYTYGIRGSRSGSLRVAARARRTLRVAVSRG